MTKKRTIIDPRYELLSNSDDYITISTPARIRKYVNQAYCDLFETSSSTLVGTSITRDFPGEKVLFYNEFIKEMSPVSPSISTTQKTGAAGKEIWVSWKETGIFDENSVLIEIMSVGRNVNDIYAGKKENEQLLHTLNAFKHAVDTNVICTITDPKGRITYANENFCAISKYSKEELIGKTHNIVNSAYHPKEFFADMWNTITKGEMWTGEIKNIAKDGSYYWVKSVIVPIKDEKERITGYLSLRILINERKRMEEERIAYMKSLESMLHMVSHEIRKPITSCQGILNIMQDRVPGTDEEYFEAVNHLMLSASELDDYSRKLNDYLHNNLKIVQPYYGDS